MDMASARKIGHRIGMLHEGRLIWQGSVDEIDRSGDARVDQFIHGRAEQFGKLGGVGRACVGGEVARAGQKSSHKLGPMEYNTKQAQGVFVVLPKKLVYAEALHEDLYAAIGQARDEADPVLHIPEGRRRA